MRLFISGIAAASLLAVPMVGCKKDTPAEAPAAEGEATAEAEKPAEGEATAEAEKPAEGEAAGGAEKPAEGEVKAEEPAEVKAEEPAEEAKAEEPAEEAKAEEAAALPAGFDEEAVEAGIKMMESFGTIMAANKNDCDALAKAVTEFNNENGEALKAFSQKMQDADPSVQKALESKYKDRMEKTIGEIMMGGMACQANENFAAAMKAMEGGQDAAGDEAGDEDGEE